MSWITSLRKGHGDGFAGYVHLGFGKINACLDMGIVDHGKAFLSDKTDLTGLVTDQSSVFQAGGSQVTGLS